MGVEDIDASIAFYSTLFAAEPSVVKSRCGPAAA
jgi:hypothetical protein